MNINSIQQQPTTFKSKVNKGYEAASFLKGYSNSKSPIKTQIRELENNGISDLVFIDLVTLADNTRKLVMRVIRDAGRNGYKGTAEVILDDSLKSLNLKSMYNSASKKLDTPVSRYRELSEIA